MIQRHDCSGGPAGGYRSRLQSGAFDDVEVLERTNKGLYYKGRMNHNTYHM